MADVIKIKSIYTDSFVANSYSKHPFRMIGLINVDIEYNGKKEKVTLAYYRSSGTNNGKIKGLWYPIVGIKLYSGSFTEFSPLINNILSRTTNKHSAKKGWLCKSLFFNYYLSSSKLDGFSNSKHYRDLLVIGKVLRNLYESGNYIQLYTLTPANFNKMIYSESLYESNTRSQRKNFEKFIGDIV